MDDLAAAERAEPVGSIEAGLQKMIGALKYKFFAGWVLKYKFFAGWVFSIARFSGRAYVRRCAETASKRGAVLRYGAAARRRIGRETRQKSGSMRLPPDAAISGAQK